MLPAPRGRPIIGETSALYTTEEAPHSNRTGKMSPTRARVNLLVSRNELLVSHDLSVLHRNRLAGIVIHVHVVLLAVQDIYHLVTGGNFGGVIRGRAPLLCRRVSMPL